MVDQDEQHWPAIHQPARTGLLFAGLHPLQPTFTHRRLAHSWSHIKEGGRTV